MEMVPPPRTNQTNHALDKQGVSRNSRQARQGVAGCKMTQAGSGRRRTAQGIVGAVWGAGNE